MNKKIIGVFVGVLFLPIVSHAQVVDRVTLFETLNALLMRLNAALTAELADTRTLAAPVLGGTDLVQKDRDQLEAQLAVETKKRIEAEALNAEVHRLRMENHDAKRLADLCLVKTSRAEELICQEENL